MPCNANRFASSAAPLSGLNANGGVCMQCARSSTGSSRHFMLVGIQEAGLAASLLERNYDWYKSFVAEGKC